MYIFGLTISSWKHTSLGAFRSAGHFRDQATRRQDSAVPRAMFPPAASGLKISFLFFFIASEGGKQVFSGYTTCLLRAFQLLFRRTTHALLLGLTPEFDSMHLSSKTKLPLSSWQSPLRSRKNEVPDKNTDL
jgi:hypothetical protein